METGSRGGSAVGLLITPKTLTATAVRVQDGRPVVTARGSVEIPDGVMAGMEIMEPSRLAQAIRSLWRKLALRERTVTVTLPTPAYGLRTLRLPGVAERERRALVRGELEQMAALPFGAGGFDFLWMPPVSGSQATEIAAFFASDPLI